MNTDRELMQQALEALDGTEALLSSMDVTHLLIYGEVEKAITAIREALAEQPAQQEPVAVQMFRTPGCSDWYDGVPDQHELGQHEVRTLYTSPQPAQQALDKMAENARELGLDYEPAQQEPQQPVQEPVAEYIGECNDGSLVQLYDDVKKGAKFYISPPQRKPLTDDEIKAASLQAGMQEHYMGFHSGFIRFARAIEAAHGIKENT